MAEFEALLQIECPRVAEAFSELIAKTRRIAGAQIKRSWKVIPAKLGEEMDISDIDYSGLAHVDQRYLIVAGEHLGLGPDWLWRFAQWVLRR